MFRQSENRQRGGFRGEKVQQLRSKLHPAPAHHVLVGRATPSPAPDSQSAPTPRSRCLTIYGDEIAGLGVRPFVRPSGLKPQKPD